MRKLSNTKQYDNSFQGGRRGLVLSCLYIGIGYSHLEALLNITGLPCMAEGTFKAVERSVGHTVETAVTIRGKRRSSTRNKTVEESLLPFHS